jgi:nitrogen regulatory protein PII
VKDSVKASQRRDTPLVGPSEATAAERELKKSQVIDGIIESINRGGIVGDGSVFIWGLV